MIRDFRKRQYELQTMALNGQKPNEKEIDRLQQLYSMLLTNPEIKDFLDAEIRLDRLYADIYKIIGDTIEIDFNSEEQKNETIL
jgi:cell fate (sporulation/competence/biofilm development) regulator YlbF (YheA/YmcA/DUF963 family)